MCSGGELAVARAGRLPDGARRLPRQQQDASPSCERAVELGVGPDHRRLLPRDRPAGRGRSRELGRRARVMVRVTAGRRGAHARVHRHRPRGPEVRLLDQQRRRARGGAPDPARPPDSSCSACTPTSARRSSTPPGFEVAARRVLALHAQISEEIGVQLPELDLGGGFGIAYTTQDDPSDAAQLATEMTKIVARRVRGPRPRRCRGCRSSPAARSPGRRVCTRLRGRHGQGRRARRRRGAHLRLGRRRDERQHPHRPLRRRLLRARSPTAPPTPPALMTRSSASTARPATSSSRTSSCPATSRPATWSPCRGTGAYCRSMASNYNHALAPAGGRGPRRASRGSSCAGRRWTTCWPPTSAEPGSPGAAAAPTAVRRHDRREHRCEDVAR